MNNKKDIVKSVYFSNWGDNIGYPLAYALLPLVSRISFLTPNVISILAFCLYTIGSVSLFLEYPYHRLISTLLLPAAFVLDDLDGQIARFRKLSSVIGDYLDKTLDVLKIFIITASLGFAVFQETYNILYIFLAFATCFFFNYRYYIKLETMFSAMSRDKEYLEKSARVRKDEEEKIERKLQSKSLLKRLWLRHQTILWVDEAEFALFTAFGALFNQLPLTLVILALSQGTIAFWRLYQRGIQLKYNSEKLLHPLRK